MQIIRSHMMDFVPASHEDPISPGVFKKILLERDDLMSGQVQMINWALLPKNSAFERHYHEDMQEIFIIVRGTVTISVDDEEASLGPGDAVVVPMKSVHQMTNAGTEQVEYIVIGITKGENGKTILVHEK